MAYTTVNKSSAFQANNNYNGTGSTLNLTGFDFQPDLNITTRCTSGNNWAATDSVRGATKAVFPDLTSAENIQSGGVTAFNSDGYTVGTGGDFNDNGAPYQSWNFKAGTTSGITQGGASITPSGYSFNATSGFSIITYTGTGSAATIPHGLGKAPKAIWVKRRDNANGWCVYFKGDGAGYYQRLNDPNSRQADNNIWNATDPTANVFSVGTDSDVNSNGGTFVAYCFSEVQGYCKIGTYNGNGSTDGVHVYCGFRPSTVYIKERASGSKQWFCYNDQRLGYNTENRPIAFNNNSAESSNYYTLLTATGFKPLSTDSALNVNGNDYNYMAFGQTIVGTNNIPNNAR